MLSKQFLPFFSLSLFSIHISNNVTLLEWKIGLWLEFENEQSFLPVDILDILI